MRLSSIAVAVLATLTITSTLRAQLTPVPNSGCQDGTPIGGEIFPVAAMQPTLGNVFFALEHVCPPQTTHAFFLVGGCSAAVPLADWNLTDACFGTWSAPPGVCGRAYDAFYMLDGGVAQQGGKVIYPFPIPNIPALVTLTQTTPVCFQFVCVQLGTPNPCVGISMGLQMIVQ